MMKICFHFLHCFAAVTLLDASMVGSQYENSVIKDACIFYGLDNLADISIQLLEFLIICGSVMSFSVSGMVGTIIADSNKSRMFLLYVSLDAILPNSLGVLL